MKILTIEDDAKISEVLRQSLSDAGFEVESIIDGETGLEKIQNNKFDAIVLDLMLPGIDGLSVLTKMRSQKIQTPVLVLSAKHSVDDRILGLQKGADDYLVKPFAVSELIVRLQALIRRSSQSHSNSIEEPKFLVYENVKMDIEKREVSRGDVKIPLQVKEFALLELLLKNPTKVLTKSLILEKIWGYDFDPQTNVVDVLVCRLRNKVDKDFTDKIIQTHRGVGYVLKKD